MAAAAAAQGRWRDVPGRWPCGCDCAAGECSWVLGVPPLPGPHAIMLDPILKMFQSDNAYVNTSGRQRCAMLRNQQLLGASPCVDTLSRSSALLVHCIAASRPMRQSVPHCSTTDS